MFLVTMVVTLLVLKRLANSHPFSCTRVSARLATLIGISFQYGLFTLETGVQEMKHILTKVLGEHKLQFEDLATLQM